MVGHCPVPLGIAATAVLLGRDILSPLEQSCPPVPGKVISLVSNLHPSLPYRLLPSSCCSVELEQRI